MFNDQLSSPARVNLGVIFRTKTRNIQYFVEGLVCSFVSAFGKKFAFFCIKTLLSGKILKLTNEIDIKCVMWGAMNSCILDGKADGCLQWFLSRLA